MYMSPVIIFSVFGNVLRTQYLIPKEMDKEYTVSLVLGALSNFIMNSLLIKKYGAVGATIGTVIAEIVLCSYQAWSVRKDLNIFEYIKNSIPFAFFGMIMFMIIKVLDANLGVSIINLILEALIGAAVYILLTYIYCRNAKNQVIKELYDRVTIKLKTVIKRK